MDESGTQWRETNRASWDERVPFHVASEFYDVQGFQAGRPAIQPFEVDELGPLTGRLAHLQCHFGLDTLDLVRQHRELHAVGLDFSAPAIAAATQLADEVHLASRCSFVTADCYDAVSALGGATFDVVYTGKGAICWLPDIRLWADAVAGLLRPGGFLYLVEFHPAMWTLSPSGPTLAYDYFDAGPFMEESAGSYAVSDVATTSNVTYSWQHTISAVIDALIQVGLRLEFFHEWDYTVFEPFPWMVRDGHKRWRFPGPGSLPMQYSLKARRPH